MTVLFCSPTLLLCVRGELNNLLTILEQCYDYLTAVLEVSYWHLITVLFCSSTLCQKRNELWSWNSFITVLELYYYYLISILSCLILLIHNSPLPQRRIEQSYSCLRTFLFLSHHGLRSVLLPSYHNLILLFYTSPLC